MDLTIESALATADTHIERLNAESEPLVVAIENDNFQPVGSSEGVSE